VACKASNFRASKSEKFLERAECCQQLCRRKSKQEAAFWQIFNERCPYKGVLFDEIDTNCGIVNSVSIYLTWSVVCLFVDLFVNVFGLASGLVSKICVHFDARKKKIIKLHTASRMTFRAWFYRTDPQNIGGQFGTFSGFLRNTFKSERANKSPKIYFRRKGFKTIFEKRTVVYSLAAPLLGLAKSIY